MSSTHRSASLAKRLATYSAAAAATAVGASAADAAVTTHDINLLVDSVPGTMFNVVTGNDTAATSTFQYASSAVHVFATATNGSGWFGVQPGAGLVVQGTLAAPLGAGASIGGSLAVGSTSFVPVGPQASTQYFNAGERAFIGFSFLIGGNTHYGWADVTQQAGGGIHVNRLAYETQADTPIVTPEIPEPASLTLLALGAVGVAARRRQSQARKA